MLNFIMIIVILNFVHTFRNTNRLQCMDFIQILFVFLKCFGALVGKVDVLDENFSLLCVATAVIFLFVY